VMPGELLTPPIFLQRRDKLVVMVRGDWQNAIS
jgi:hypothetical protein